LALALGGTLALATIAPAYGQTSQDPPATSSTPAPAPEQTAATPAPAPEQTAAQLQQLVAPIALYPDTLVAQILAAATYPAEVVEAERWLGQHPGLKGKQLADEVNNQPWDPSVKSLTVFPAVLANMDRNLSWTSSLGEAYVGEPGAVMDAVQALRHCAQAAGTLQSTSQVKVATQGQIITIEPASPDVVYVPEYDPWLAYGPPVAAWPGWNPYPGLYTAGPGIVFGLGIGIGLLAGFGWGWHHWGFDWGRRAVVFDHRAFISRNARFVDRRAAFERHGFVGRDHGVHGGFGHRGIGGAHAFHGGFGSRGFHHFAGGHFAGGHFAGGHFGGGFHGGGFHGGHFGGGFHGGGRR
jgi:hypothetical protein